MNPPLQINESDLNVMAASKVAVGDTPDDILRAIVRACQPHAQVESVAFFCRADRPEQLLSTIRMSGNMEAAASAIAPALVRNGELCTFVSTPVSFKCARRLDGKVLKPMCSDCRWTGAQCRAQLD